MDASVVVLAVTPALASLTLAGCFSITDASVRALVNFPTLTFLDLIGCEFITDAGILAMADALVLKTLLIEDEEEDEERDYETLTWEGILALKRLRATKGMPPLILRL
jgi:hypothetical protein